MYLTKKISIEGVEVYRHTKNGKLDLRGVITLTNAPTRKSKPLQFRRVLGVIPNTPYQVIRWKGELWLAKYARGYNGHVYYSSSNWLMPAMPLARYKAGKTNLVASV